eukprot:TRINITY_DN767_c0_g2_i1.p1 TRINITY_DN767_c0_g2~~TRINITY_DN767_c0_g2_i1.p1  ORF type:complete len:2284 (-),score=828.55 TRINITY_DN767_c0_g2_i1:294-7145(-)
MNDYGAPAMPITTNASDLAPVLIQDTKNNCNACNTQYSMFKKKTSCQCCGQHFCPKCLSKQVLPGTTQKKLVCMGCQRHIAVAQPLCLVRCLNFMTKYTADMQNQSTTEDARRQLQTSIDQATMGLETIWNGIWQNLEQMIDTNEYYKETMKNFSSMNGIQTVSHALMVGGMSLEQRARVLVVLFCYIRCCQLWSQSGDSEPLDNCHQAVIDSGIIKVAIDDFSSRHVTLQSAAINLVHKFMDIAPLKAVILHDVQTFGLVEHSCDALLGVESSQLGTLLQLIYKSLSTESGTGSVEVFVRHGGFLLVCNSLRNPGVMSDAVLLRDALSMLSFCLGGLGQEGNTEMISTCVNSLVENGLMELLENVLSRYGACIASASGLDFNILQANASLMGSLSSHTDIKSSASPKSVQLIMQLFLTGSLTKEQVSIQQSALQYICNVLNYKPQGAESARRLEGLIRTLADLDGIRSIAACITDGSAQFSSQAHSYAITILQVFSKYEFAHEALAQSNILGAMKDLLANKQPPSSDGTALNSQTQFRNSIYAADTILQLVVHANLAVGQAILSKDVEVALADLIHATTTPNPLKLKSIASIHSLTNKAELLFLLWSKENSCKSIIEAFIRLLSNSEDDTSAAWGLQILQNMCGMKLDEELRHTEGAQLCRNLLSTSGPDSLVKLLSRDAIALNALTLLVLLDENCGDALAQAVVSSGQANVVAKLLRSGINVNEIRPWAKSEAEMNTMTLLRRVSMLPTCGRSDRLMCTAAVSASVGNPQLMRQALVALTRLVEEHDFWPIISNASLPTLVQLMDYQSPPISVADSERSSVVLDALKVLSPMATETTYRQKMLQIGMLAKLSALLACPEVKVSKAAAEAFVPLNTVEPSAVAASLNPALLATVIKQHEDPKTLECLLSLLRSLCESTDRAQSRQYKCSAALLGAVIQLMSKCAEVREPCIALLQLMSSSNPSQVWDMLTQTRDFESMVSLMSAGDSESKCRACVTLERLWGSLSNEHKSKLSSLGLVKSLSDIFEADIPATLRVPAIRLLVLCSKEDSFNKDIVALNTLSRSLLTLIAPSIEDSQWLLVLDVLEGIQAHSNEVFWSWICPNEEGLSALINSLEVAISSLQNNSQDVPAKRLLAIFSQAPNWNQWTGTEPLVQLIKLLVRLMKNCLDNSSEILGLDVVLALLNVEANVEPFVRNGGLSQLMRCLSRNETEKVLPIVKAALPFFASSVNDEELMEYVQPSAEAMQAAPVAVPDMAATLLRVHAVKGDECVSVMLNNGVVESLCKAVLSKETVVSAAELGPMVWLLSVLISFDKEEVKRRAANASIAVRENLLRLVNYILSEAKDTTALSLPAASSVLCYGTMNDSSVTSSLHAVLCCLSMLGQSVIDTKKLYVMNAPVIMETVTDEKNDDDEEKEEEKEDDDKENENNEKETVEHKIESKTSGVSLSESVLATQQLADVCVDVLAAIRKASATEGLPGVDFSAALASAVSSSGLMDNSAHDCDFSSMVPLCSVVGCVAQALHLLRNALESISSCVSVCQLHILSVPGSTARVDTLKLLMDFLSSITERLFESELDVSLISFFHKSLDAMFPYYASPSQDTSVAAGVAIALRFLMPCLICHSARDIHRTLSSLLLASLLCIIKASELSSKVPVWSLLKRDETEQLELLVKREAEGCSLASEMLRVWKRSRDVFGEEALPAEPVLESCLSSLELCPGLPVPDRFSMTSFIFATPQTHFLGPKGEADFRVHISAKSSSLPMFPTNSSDISATTSDFSSMMITGESGMSTTSDLGGMMGTMGSVPGQNEEVKDEYSAALEQFYGLGQQEQQQQQQSMTMPSIPTSTVGDDDLSASIMQQQHQQQQHDVIPSPPSMSVGTSEPLKEEITSSIPSPTSHASSSANLYEQAFASSFDLEDQFMSPSPPKTDVSSSSNFVMPSLPAPVESGSSITSKPLQASTPPQFGSSEIAMGAPMGGSNMIMSSPPKSSPPPTETSSGTWTCGFCTFENTKEFALVCEMCSQTREDAPSPSGKQEEVVEQQQQQQPQPMSYPSFDMTPTPSPQQQQQPSPPITSMLMGTQQQQQQPSPSLSPSPGMNMNMGMSSTSPSPPAPSSSTSASGGSWICEACTFENTKPMAAVCEVCGTQRKDDPNASSAAGGDISSSSAAASGSGTSSSSGSHFPPVPPPTSSNPPSSGLQQQQQSPQPSGMTELRCPRCSTHLRVPNGTRQAICSSCRATLSVPSPQAQQPQQQQQQQQRVKCVACDSLLALPPGVRDFVCPRCNTTQRL